MKKIVAISLCLAVACINCLPAAAKKEPIHIGVFLPMTGDLAAYGQKEWDGIRAAHHMLTTVLGREVKLFLEDTKSDKAEAANAVESLIKEHGVVAIIGGATSASAAAGGSVAEKNEVPMISPSATNPLVTSGKKYVFRACFQDSFQGQVAARQARIGMNAKTAAVIVDIAREDYSVELSNLFLKAFGEMGGKVLFTSYIQTGDRDFKSQLSKVLSVNPDIIYVPTYYAEGAFLAIQARDLGIKVPILMADGAQVTELIETGGEAVEGIYLTGHFSVQAIKTKRGEDFISEYKKRYNKEADAFGALGADAYFVLVNAIKRANSTEGPKVSYNLMKTKNFQGISGTMSIGENGDTVKSLVVNTVKDGKFTYVTTVNP